jgi:hypothetical protein
MNKLKRRNRRQYKMSISKVVEKVQKDFLQQLDVLAKMGRSENEIVSSFKEYGFFEFYCYEAARKSRSGHVPEAKTWQQYGMGDSYEYNTFRDVMKLVNKERHAQWEADRKAHPEPEYMFETADGMKCTIRWNEDAGSWNGYVEGDNRKSYTDVEPRLEKELGRVCGRDCDYWGTWSFCSGYHCWVPMVAHYASVNARVWTFEDVKNTLFKAAAFMKKHTL